MSSGLVLDWRCRGETRPEGDAGYKAGSRYIGAHVIHLWDRRLKFFYGYRVGIGQTGSFRYDRTTEYQTLGAALLAAEQEMRFYGPLT
jgi:hypothetical protein